MKRHWSWFTGRSRITRALIASAVPLVVLIFFIESWTTPTSGHVLAEGEHLGVFKASEKPSELDSPQARRFVITKVEAYDAGVLDDFPPDCSVTTCSSSPPGDRPIVVIWAEPEQRCSGGSAADFEACVGPLTNQCAVELSTYIRTRDSAGHAKLHSCAYFDIAHPSGQYALGFVIDGQAPPKRFSLVVQGRNVPLRL